MKKAERSFHRYALRVGGGSAAPMAGSKNPVRPTAARGFVCFYDGAGGRRRSGPTSRR